MDCLPAYYGLIVLGLEATMWAKKNGVETIETDDLFS